MCCKEIIKESGVDEICFDNKTSAKENNVSFHIEYPKGETFCRIKMDGCFSKSQDTKKCDFVFLRCKIKTQNDKKEVYYVELKGQDIKQAYKQILETLKIFAPSPKEKIYGFIVASKVPTRQIQKNKKLEKDFVKNHGVGLVIKSQKHIHIVK